MVEKFPRITCVIGVISSVSITPATVRSTGQESTELRSRKQPEFPEVFLDPRQKKLPELKSIRKVRNINLSEEF